MNNIPNKLTISRFFIAIIFIIFFNIEFSDIVFKKIILIIILIVGYLTDILDGIIARSKKQITTFGIFADPVADKFLIATVMLLLVSDGKFHPIYAIILIGRDIIITGFRAFAATQNIIIPAIMTGKIKMCFESILLIYILLDLDIIYINIILLGGSIFFSILSLFICIYKYRLVFKK